MKGEIIRKSQIKALLNVKIVKLRAHVKTHFKRQVANVNKKNSISFRKACKQQFIVVQFFVDLQNTILWTYFKCLVFNITQALNFI